MLCDDIRYITKRALWETENLMACIPDKLWNQRYDAIPMWKYLYHMLYSMDRWFIDPNDPEYRDPEFHLTDLANLNVIPEKEFITREQLNQYFSRIQTKIVNYIDKLQDEELSEKPVGCDITRFRLILGQIRHWHRHMGIIYGFIIMDDGKWPYVLNMQGAYPTDPMPNYYE